MSKKNSLDALKALFRKELVLNMDQLRSALGTTARMTAFRYLQELHCLTSYTHNGKYYTLPEIARFDSDGFWYFGEIGFSQHGTLIDTLIYVISQSESGKTNSELEAYFRTRVQDALNTLLKAQKISRTKPSNRYVYVSHDPMISEQQIKRRLIVGDRKRLPDWIVAEILIETIRSFPTKPDIENVLKRLSKKGSQITYGQVKQVFEENDLEKKIPD